MTLPKSLNNIEFSFLKDGSQYIFYILKTLEKINNKMKYKCEKIG